MMLVDGQQHKVTLFIVVMELVMFTWVLLWVVQYQHIYHLLEQMLVVLVIHQQDVRQLTPTCTQTICFTRFRRVVMGQHLVLDVVTLNWVPIMLMVRQWLLVMLGLVVLLMVVQL
jgi:hypothetical protein